MYNFLPVLAFFLILAIIKISIMLIKHRRLQDPPQTVTPIPEPSFVRSETEIRTEGNLTSSQSQVFTIFDAQNMTDLPSYHDVVIIDLPTYDEIMQNNQNMEFDRSFVQR